jgi:hypothetical protein
MTNPICTQVDMDRLIQALRGVDEVEVARARSLAGSETWSGPRADAVREDLKRIHLILSDAIELAWLHRSSALYSIDAELSHDQWGF